VTADIGRESVYAAEVAAFEGTNHEVVVPFGELVDLAHTVTAAPWWPRGDITIVPARTDARSSSARQRGSGSPVVRLAAPQMTAATVLHELAHVLAGVARGHDSVFRAAHVDLVGYSFGDEPAAWLTDAYAAMGLALGPRAWPTPPAARPARGPIAL
jgi:hypothetical protein